MSSIKKVLIIVTVTIGRPVSDNSPVTILLQDDTGQSSQLVVKYSEYVASGFNVGHTVTDTLVKS